MEEILHQLIGGVSHYLQGFIHPRCRISEPSTVSPIKIDENRSSFHAHGAAPKALHVCMSSPQK